MALDPLEIVGGLAIGEGVGGAIADVIRPRLQDLANEQWTSHRSRPLGAGEAAAAFAEGEMTEADADAEAGKSGMSETAAAAQRYLALRAPGLPELYELWRRGLIADADFQHGLDKLAIEERYRSALETAKARILNEAQWAGLWLRGWVSESEAKAGGELVGYDAEQMQLLYELQGRPAAPGQMWDMWARGAPGPYGGTFGEEDFQRGVQESDIRTEWGPPLWYIRWHYPTLFQLRAAVQGGGITPERALTILAYERYEPEDAAGLVHSWVSKGSTAAKHETITVLAVELESHYITRDEFDTQAAALGYLPDQAAAYAELADLRAVVRARDAAVGKIRSAFVAHRLTDQEAQTMLGAEGISEAAQTRIFVEWQHAKEANVAALTPAQVRKAYQKALLTETQALDELEYRGYSVADATTFLAL